MKLLEADITRQVVDFMRSEGWRPIRHQRTVIRGQFQTGEPGMPDYQFIRYRLHTNAQVLWVEFKRPDARAQCVCARNAGSRKRCTPCDQKAWRDIEKARGGLVFAGVDDLNRFIVQYREIANG